MSIRPTHCCYGHESYFSGCDDCPYAFPASERHPLPAAQDALDRMRQAAKRGTGCHFTAEMIRQLELTSIGEMWSQDRPT